MSESPPSQADPLESLRRLLARERGSAVPLKELAALADIPTGWSITIDFAASATLGCPLVVARPRGPIDSSVARLTRREREVAALVAAGRSNKEIAVLLHIAVGTVKDHIHRMLHKTGLANRTALALAVERAENRSIDADGPPLQSIFG